MIDFSGITFLVVSTDEAHTLITLRSLRDIGVTNCVVTAGGATAALEHLQKSLVHVAIVDFSMMGGQAPLLVGAISTNPGTRHVKVIGQAPIGTTDTRQFLQSYECECLEPSHSSDDLLHVLQRLYA